MISPSAIEKFKANLRGPLLRPGEAGYDEARKVWNGMIDRRPALIARCLGTADVIRSVEFVREQDLAVAVRGGGHNIAGKCLCDDGLLIDLSTMKGIHVDPVRRTARAQAGLKLGEFDRETQVFGLATTMGVATDTGMAGITLGGGYGWLDGRFGLACDNLISAEVVTAEGKVVTASADENPDLFWGLRGGSGNFGIVTSFEFQLHPVGPVLGGALFYSMSIAKEAFRFLDEFSRKCPDELTTFLAGAPAPDGTPCVGIAFCYCGKPETGEEVIKPLRKFATPIADMVATRRYVEMQSVFDEMFTPGRFYYWKSSLLRQVSEEAADVLTECTRKMPLTAGSFIYLQQLHGAASRVKPTDTAFPHRYDHYNCGAMAGWDDEAQTEKNIRWSRDSWTAMQRFCEKDAYVNDLGEEGEQRIREAYGQNYGRLVALKNKYDPTNLFRINQNIESSRATSAATSG
jgi:FAD binding domain-containing protein/berberine-like enzyme